MLSRRNLASQLSKTQVSIISEFYPGLPTYVLLYTSNKAAKYIRSVIDCVMVNSVLKLIMSKCIVNTIRSNVLLNVA